MTDQVSRLAQAEMWIGRGITVDVQPPTDEHADFVARVPEFALVAHGASDEEAIEGIFALIDNLIEGFLIEGTPLPSRTRSLDKEENRASRRDER